MKPQIGVVGASGYVGGELLRLLLSHPEVEIGQATSRRYAGRFIHHAHPNLRGATDLRFVDPEHLEGVDLLFLALPHGRGAAELDRYRGLAARLIDCSADFRLESGEVYERWYGEPHPAREWLPRFVYGFPERRRRQLDGAHYASGVGCNAAALILALAPLADAGLLQSAWAEVKVGSSEAGGAASASSHHPERQGAVRIYQAFGHRHLAEVEQEFPELDLAMTATAIEMVRGVHVTVHGRLAESGPIRTQRDLWGLYREAYEEERFVRLVARSSGRYRLPEPKFLAGSNYCDVGFHLEEGSGRVLLVSALDNLMKGSAGSAVQAMNLMLGMSERAGLGFPGLHPL